MHGDFSETGHGPKKQTLRWLAFVPACVFRRKSARKYLLTRRSSDRLADSPWATVWPRVALRRRVGYGAMERDAT